MRRHKYITAGRGRMPNASVSAVRRRLARDLISEQRQIGSDIQNRQSFGSRPEEGFSWPLRGHGTVTSRFGLRRHPVTGVRAPHLGIDISAPEGASVYPIRSGTVILVRNLPHYGQVAVVDHGGAMTSVYAHLSSVWVQEDGRVVSDAAIGAVGRTGRTTGPHLHLEIRFSGKAVDPLRVVQPPRQPCHT